MALDHSPELRCALVAIVFSGAEQNHFSNFGRGSPKGHFCEIIFISSHWPRRRCRLKVFLFLALAVILFNGAEPF